MSGGHWDYAGQRIEDCCDRVGGDGVAIKRWPQTAAIFRALGNALFKAERGMDWDLSGDSIIENDAEWDNKTSAAILNAAINAASTVQRDVLLNRIASMLTQDQD